MNIFICPYDNMQKYLYMYFKTFQINMSELQKINKYIITLTTIIIGTSQKNAKKKFYEMRAR